MFFCLVSLDERCKLYCRDSQNILYYSLMDKVVDGTVCGPNTFDICVNGICQPAGCDHILNSKKQLGIFINRLLYWLKITY